MMTKAIGILLVCLLMSNALATEMDIVDFIVIQNDEVIQARSMSGLDIKVDARLSAIAGTTGQFTDRAVAGLSMTIPLIDTRERRELRQKAITTEAQIRQKAVDFQDIVNL